MPIAVTVPPLERGTSSSAATAAIDAATRHGSANKYSFAYWPYPGFTPINAKPTRRASDDLILGGSAPVLSAILPTPARASHSLGPQRHERRSRLARSR